MLVNNCCLPLSLSLFSLDFRKWNLFWLYGFLMLGFVVKSVVFFDVSRFLVNCTNSEREKMRWIYTFFCSAHQFTFVHLYCFFFFFFSFLLISFLTYGSVFCYRVCLMYRFDGNEWLPFSNVSYHSTDFACQNIGFLCVWKALIRWQFIQIDNGCL